MHARLLLIGRQLLKQLLRVHAEKQREAEYSPTILAGPPGTNKGNA